MSDESFMTAWEHAQPIEGWLSKRQARALFDAANGVGSGSAIVEIGSHRGRSTVVLGHAAGAGIDVVAVDPFDDARWGGGRNSLAVLRENLSLSDLAKCVRVLRATSASAARDWDGDPIGLLYVDGAHDRRSVITDIDGWLPHLRRGGHVAFHDAFSSLGVTLALLQRFLGRSGFAYAGSVGSLVIFQREDASRLGTLRLSAHLLARLPYFARNVGVKVALRRGWRPVCRVLGHATGEQPY